MMSTEDASSGEEGVVFEALKDALQPGSFKGVSPREIPAQTSYVMLRWLFFFVYETSQLWVI